MGLYSLVAGHFASAATAVHKMYDLLGGWERGEKQLRALANNKIRLQIAGLIDECKASDSSALSVLKALSKSMS